MQSEVTRAAFTLLPVYRRRDSHRVTAVAVHQNGTRVFLGLENGHLEEYRLSRGTTPPTSTSGVKAAQLTLAVCS